MIRRPIISQRSKNLLERILDVNDSFEFGEYKKRYFKISVEGSTVKVPVFGKGKFFADEIALSRFLSIFSSLRLPVFKTRYFVVGIRGKFSLKFLKTKISVSLNYDFSPQIISHKKHKKQSRRFAQFLAHVIYYGEGWDGLLRIPNLIIFPSESRGFSIFTYQMVRFNLHPSGSYTIDEDSKLSESGHSLSLNGSSYVKKDSLFLGKPIFIGSKVFIQSRRRAVVIFNFNLFSYKVFVEGNHPYIPESRYSNLTDEDLLDLTYSITKYKGRKKLFYRMAIVSLVRHIRGITGFTDDLKDNLLAETQLIDFDFKWVSSRSIHLLRDELKFRVFSEKLTTLDFGSGLVRAKFEEEKKRFRDIKKAKHLDKQKPKQKEQIKEAV